MWTELADILPDARLVGAGDWQITGLAYDSRRVKPGDLFIAVPGFTVDGHDYIPQALARGARAVVVEQAQAVPAGVPHAIVADSRKALGLLAAKFFGYPSRDLRVLGVTGTNGKTTTTYLIRAILAELGYPTGLVGTVQQAVGDQVWPAGRTTPEGPDLQKLLLDMKQAGCRHAVMEVSSHALELGRVVGIEFAGAIMTNITQDHLDFHPDMAAYVLAKQKLFAGLSGDRYAVLNQDDRYVDQIRAVCQVPVFSYGIASDRCDVRAVHIRLGPDRAQFVILAKDIQLPVTLPLTGRFNVYNALAAFAVGLAEGVPIDAIKRGLESMAGVPGRMERIDCGQDFAVLVDYAHTPDGLENLLTAVREFTPERVICVVGCGGDRDRSKRPLMGEIAGRLADISVLTADNPRSEDPAAIAAQMRTGLEKTAGGRFIEILDRRAAIRWAIGAATGGDSVVIAGKGHETYQIYKDWTVEFDDRHEARLALQELGWQGEKR